MTYSKQTWIDNNSSYVLSAARMTHIEDGVEAVETAAVAHAGNTSNPHAVTKAQVGLSAVDNTSDATKNSATATLTNKTISLASNTVTGTKAQFNTAISDADMATLTGTETLTNKTLTAPAITSPTGIVKADVGLSNVDNTSDVNKPLSTPQKDYIASRSGNMFTNGGGHLGTTYNFSSGWTLNQADHPVGARASFQCNVQTQTSRFCDEFYVVDPSKTYRFSFHMKQLSGSGSFYSFIQPLDAAGNVIATQHYMVKAGTLTTLAAPLNPGDTTVTLTDATNWENANVNTYTRYIRFWDYTDSFGYTWPADTYSRNITAYDTWAIGGITGNVITLNAPYSGPAKAAGVQVSNGNLGGTYMYLGAVNVAGTSSWVAYSGEVSGVHTDNTTSATTSLPYGTSYVQVGWLFNYGTISSPVQAIGNVTLREVPVASSTVVGGIKLAGDIGNTAQTPYVTATHLAAALPIAQGGTGRVTSTTAYGLLAAGTTATGVHQTLATGSSGQILKSNGSAALPTFQTGAPADVALGNVDNTSDATKNAATATLTNKTVSLASNTLTGTTAQFNTALSDGDFATLAGSETLTNKTLTTPIIVSISNSGTITVPTGTDTLVARATTDTLTNKRITARVSTSASTATLTADMSLYDSVHLTAQAAALTIAAPTGTPTASQRLIIRIKDDGTSRAITWNAIFRPVGVALPAATVISKILYVLAIYNSTETLWDVVSIVQEV